MDPDNNKDIPENESLEYSLFLLCEKCLDLNINEDEFLDMSLGEINRKINSYKRIKEEENKNNLFLIHTLAALEATSMSRLFNKNAKYPNLYEAFPKVFEKELEDYLESKEKAKMEMLLNMLKSKAEIKE